MGHSEYSGVKTCGGHPERSRDLCVIPTPSAEEREGEERGEVGEERRGVETRGEERKKYSDHWETY